MKKGLELPVNMIIVIAIAVLVLVVIAAYFATQTGSGFDAIAANGALTSSCGAWLSSSCSVAAASTITTNLKNADGTPVTLAMVFQKLSLDPTTTARARCGCPSTT